jgi:tRNA(Ile)-lysidine synthase
MSLRPRAVPRASGLLSRVRHGLDRRRLFDGATRVLVACSGGPDSQVLLHALWALRDHHRCELIAATVDHGLRPEAASEADLVRELAGRLGVPFVSLSVVVPAGPSLQAQAREARYAALLACAADQGAQRIAVGHTMDDQAETVLARVLRGAGLEGLQGIVPKRADGVVRPLIEARRAQVLKYAQTQDLRFAQDPSNCDAKFLRVRVRHSLLPRLEIENPRLVEHLAALAEDVREVSELLEPEVARVRSKLFDGSAPLAREESPYLRRSALKLLVEEKTGRAIHRTHLAALERMLEEGGQVRLPGDMVASIGTGGQLCFSPVEKRGRGVTRPRHGAIKSKLR